LLRCGMVEICQTAQAKRTKDTNKLAAEILGEAIEDNDKEEKSEETNSEEESEVKKNPHAQELGRLRG
jgi:hypothetical protein